MVFRAKILTLLVPLGLAACATAPPYHPDRAPDWDQKAEARPAATPLPSFHTTSVPPSSPGGVGQPSADGTAPAASLEANHLQTPALRQSQAGEGGNGVALGRGMTLVSLARWCQAAGLPAPLCLTSGGSGLYEVRWPQGRFDVRAGSLLAYWNGLEIHLGFAPQLIGGELFLHALDLQKTLQPLRERFPEPAPDREPVLVIDPGHGGADAGTQSAVQNGYEKDYTLDWAQRLQSLMTSNHWQVYLTRNKDVDMPLSNRVAFAESWKADVFISLHFNSAGSDQVDGGLETYCLTPAGMPSSLTRGYADDLGQVFPNNAFDERNLQLAVLLHRALLQVNGHHDRGVRRARFPTVLRGQQRPAVLIEGGYLSSPREARLIASPAYRQALAEAVARALTEGVGTAMNHGAEPNTANLAAKPSP